MDRWSVEIVQAGVPGGPHKVSGFYEAECGDNALLGFADQVRRASGDDEGLDWWSASYGQVDDAGAPIGPRRHVGRGGIGPGLFTSLGSASR